MDNDSLYFGCDDCIGFHDVNNNKTKIYHKGSYTDLKHSLHRLWWKDDQGQGWVMDETHDKISVKDYIQTTMSTDISFRPSCLVYWEDKFETDSYGRDNSPTCSLEDILDSISNTALATEIRSNIKRLEEEFAKHQPKILCTSTFEGYFDVMPELSAYKPNVRMNQYLGPFKRDYSDCSSWPLYGNRELTPPVPLVCCRLDLRGEPICLHTDGTFSVIERVDTPGKRMYLSYVRKNFNVTTLV